MAGPEIPCFALGAALQLLMVPAQGPSMLASDLQPLPMPLLPSPLSFPVHPARVTGPVLSAGDTVINERPVFTFIGHLLGTEEQTGFC